MKKWSKRIVKTVGIIVAALGLFAGGVYASEQGFTLWPGKDDYTATKEIFGDLRNGITDEKEAKKAVDKLLADANGTIKTQKTTIDNYESTIEDLETEKGILTTDLAAANKKVGELETKVTGLETKVDNSVSKDVIAQKVNAAIKTINSKNGPKHKYTEIQTLVNNHGGFFGVTETLVDHGDSEEDLHLKQAIADMKDIREEAEALKTLLENELPE